MTDESFPYVFCAAMGCNSRSNQVKFTGGMPKNWYGVWDEKTKKLLIVCSEECLEKVHNERLYYR